jgi:WD40 repeat protein
MSASSPSYGLLLEELMHGIDARGGSPQAAVESLLGGRQLWWRRCQEAIREDPGWLSGPRSGGIRGWLIATAGGGPGHAADSVRRAVDCAYLVSQALSGKPDHQHNAARLAQVAQQWDQSGLLLPPLGTGVISAGGTPAAEAGLTGGIDRVITALSAQAGDLREVSEPARAVVAVTALLLAGAKPLDRHAGKVAIVFGRADDQGRDSGTAGFLELREFPGGPAGLFPDPRWMAGARAMSPEFAEALAVAWRYCGGDRCVLWRIILPDDPTWIPVLDGGSLGAAFTLGLLDLLRSRGSRRSALAPARRGIYRLRPGTAVTGHMDDHGGLHRVGGMEAKLLAAHRKRWLLIAPEENRADLSQAPDPRLVKSAPTIRQASRYAHQWRAGRLTIAAALVVALAIATTLITRANTQAAQAHTQTTLQRDITLSEQLAADSLTVDATDPDTARQLAVASWAVSPTAQASSAMTTLLAEQQQEGMLPIASSYGDVDSMAFSPGNGLLATASLAGTVQLWNLATGQPTGKPLPSGTSNAVRNWMAFSPDGRLLATVEGKGTVRLWNPATRKPAGTPLPAGIAYDGMAFSPNSQLLATADANGTVRLWDVATGKLVGTPMSGGGVTQIAFSPDGKLLAAAGNGSGTVQLWNLATDKAAGAPLPAGTDPYSPYHTIAFSPDGKLLATADDENGNGTIQLWNVATGRATGVSVSSDIATDDGHVITVAFTPDGRLMAAASNGAVQLWDPATGKPAGTPLAPGTGQPSTGVGDSETAAAFSPDGTLVATATSGMVRLWDAATGKPAGTSLPIEPPLAADSRPGGSVSGLAFSPDGKLLATAESDSASTSLRLWDVATGKPARNPLPITSYNGTLNGVTFGPDGRLPVVFGNGRIQEWNPATAAALPPGSDGVLTGVLFSPDGKLLATGGDIIQLLDPATGAPSGKPLQAVITPSGGVTALAFSPDSRLLAVATGGDAGAEVQLWNVATRQQVEVSKDGPASFAAPNPGSILNAIAFSPDGRLLATAVNDTAADGTGGTVQLWNVATGQPAGSPLPADTNSGGTVTGVAFSPDGKLLATAEYDPAGGGTVRLWNVATGQQVGVSLSVAPGHGGTVTGVAFSPDGKLLATAASDAAGATVRLWNVPQLANPYAELCADVGGPTQQVWDQYAAGEPFTRACA